MALAKTEILLIFVSVALSLLGKCLLLRAHAMIGMVARRESLSDTSILLILSSLFHAKDFLTAYIRYVSVERKVLPMYIEAFRSGGVSVSRANEIRRCHHAFYEYISTVKYALIRALYLLYILFFLWRHMGAFLLLLVLPEIFAGNALGEVGRRAVKKLKREENQEEDRVSEFVVSGRDRDMERSLLYIRERLETQDSIRIRGEMHRALMGVLGRVAGDVFLLMEIAAIFSISTDNVAEMGMFMMIHGKIEKLSRKMGKVYTDFGKNSADLAWGSAGAGSKGAQHIEGASLEGSPGRGREGK
jgi:hypothetical protein